MSTRRPWRKNLYENQGYPDNYTDETFLKELRKNVNFKPVTLSEAIFGATLVVQELSTVVAFVLIYVYFYNEWIDPLIVFYCTSIGAAVGFMVYRMVYGNGIQPTLGHDLRTILIFLVFGQLFSPVLHTLTDTISTDTIYTTTFLMMLIHLVFFDYGVPAAVVSNSLSLSAAVFASICLSSRLSSAYQAFILITISIKFFVLFPLLRSKIKELNIITVFLVIIIIYVLSTISTLMTVLFALTILFVNVVCPIMFTKSQRYKDNIYGPWDEAVVPKAHIESE